MTKSLEKKIDEYVCLWKIVANTVKLDNEKQSRLYTDCRICNGFVCSIQPSRYCPLNPDYTKK